MVQNILGRAAGRKPGAGRGRAAQQAAVDVARLEKIFQAITDPYSGMLPPQLRGRAKDFFIYTVDFLPIAANATASEDIQIQNDSDFLIMAGTRVVTDTANTTFLGDVPQLVQINDSGSGRELTNRATHIENWFGTGQLPAYWPYPKVIKRSSTLRTTLQNLEATDRNTRISYQGFKIFDWPFSNDYIP